MARKTQNLSFNQILESLRAHSFEVTPFTGSAGSVLVSKHGAAAVLAPAQNDDASAVFAVHPGVLLNGHVARLLDRGYQKFIKTDKFELPATASQLHAIHLFTEQVKMLTGDACLYNESLGTTSDLYQYDRLKGREAIQSPPEQPWALADGH